jgi:hypothetical protein
MLRFRLESAQSESDSVTRHTDIADIRGTTDITHVTITATTVAILITEPTTTLGGRTTTAAIESTSITSIITIATKRTGWCEG